ncbi:MAG: hypothetical protein ACHQ53_11975 [Polyangiales bacterium]
MISDQLDVFPGHERFVHALLGLLSTCDAFVEALEQEGQNHEPRVQGPFVDFALGVVSLTRTLRATLGVARDVSENGSGEDGQARASAIEPGSLLR